MLAIDIGHFCPHNRPGRRTSRRWRNNYKVPEDQKQAKSPDSHSAPVACCPMGLVLPRNTRQTPDLVCAVNLVLFEQIEKLPVRIDKSTTEPVGSIKRGMGPTYYLETEAVSCM